MVVFLSMLSVVFVSLRSTWVYDLYMILGDRYEDTYFLVDIVENIIFYDVSL